MKHIAFLLFFYIFTFSPFHLLFAQDAMKVLDIAADRIRKAGNVKIEYKAGVFHGGTETASSAGTMWLQESKMKLDAKRYSLRISRRLRFSVTKMSLATEELWKYYQEKKSMI